MIRDWTWVATLRSPRVPSAIRSPERVEGISDPFVSWWSAQGSEGGEGGAGPWPATSQDPTNRDKMWASTLLSHHCGQKQPETHYRPGHICDDDCLA